MTNQPQTTNPKLLTIVEKILELKKFQKATGIVTSRSQSSFIRDLNPEELAVVAKLVNTALAAEVK